MADRPVRTGAYPELTPTAVILGYGIGSLICISIAYASLILGFSIEGSELAAILGWGVLRGVLRRTSIVENNINQTVASAVNGASAGIMFSVPALFILSDQYPGAQDFNVALMVFSCITGGVLGLSFVIPLRKQMIDFNRLAYPGGIAVAAVLKSPGAGIRKAKLLIGGAVVSGIIHVIVLWIDVKHWHPAGPPQMLNIGLYLSVMTIGVGYLSGRGGLMFGAGGFFCYWLLSPLLAIGGSEAVQSAVDAGPGNLRVLLFRPTGIGMLIGAAIGGIFAAFPLIKSSIRSMQEASRRARDGTGAISDEMPIKVLYAGIALGVLVLIVVAWQSVTEMRLLNAIGMVLLGTVWVWVAGVIVSECLGRTNWNPISGMTLIAVTLLLVIGTGGEDKAQLVTASVMVGAAICIAMAQAGDMMLDLKSGYLIGASPKKQQIGQLLGTWLGPIIVVWLTFVLHEKYTLGSDDLPAPQGKALASMVEGIIGGDVPTHRYIAGAVVGAVLAFSGLGGIGVMIGLGFYMPFDIVMTYTIGCLIRIVTERRRGAGFAHEIGIPVAAGLIVGEALVGVGYALGNL